MPQVPKSLNVVSLFPWAAVQVLEHRRPVVVPRVSALPPEAAVDRATFEALGTRAQMTVPIVSHSVVTHLMLLASVAQERDWPEILIPRLRLLGEMMVAAVQRAEVFAALQTSEERLTRTAAAAGCGLWELDPSSGEVWVTPLTRRNCHGIAQDDTVSYARFLELLHPEDASGSASPTRKRWTVMWLSKWNTGSCSRTAPCAGCTPSASEGSRDGCSAPRWM